MWGSFLGPSPSPRCCPAGAPTSSKPWGLGLLCLGQPSLQTGALSKPFPSRKRAGEAGGLPVAGGGDSQCLPSSLTSWGRGGQWSQEKQSGIGTGSKVAWVSCLFCLRGPGLSWVP